ncbi:MAG: hypothetical protein CMC38_00320 [Flavobacteriaceae bacterium]|nr:hypothetical protein [Flavobacteriaceae bacterium]
MTNYFKNILPHFVCIFILLILSITYFYPILLKKGIEQSDISQFRGMSKQIVDHRENFDEEPYWLDNAFLGMPSYQVSVIYPYDLLRIIDLSIRFLPRPADYLFLYLFSFYLLIISLKINYRYALFGSIAFGFSTYLIIILGVGHNTKALALGYLPMVIMGVLMIFRKDFLKGFLITSLALGLQIHSNHYQMTFYTLIIVMVMFIVYIIDYYKRNDLKAIFYCISAFTLSSIIALLMNASALLATKEYSEFSTRSKSEISVKPDGTLKESQTGLSKDYITEYSYGILESLNLFIPKFMGGASSERINDDSKLMDFIKTLDPKQGQQIYQYSRLYWGNQPIVAAPAYIGASILFIFFLGIFLVKNVNMRWLLPSIIISLLLSWGKNFDFLTNLMIDYFPFYNKFRAVSSIQVILEFCIPLVAVFGIYKFFSVEIEIKKRLRALYKSALILIPITLIIYLFGSKLFSFKSNFEIFSNYPEILNLLIEDRKSILQADSLRSLLIIIFLFSFLFAHLKNILNKNLSISLIIILIVFDLWTINKQYVNADQFISKSNIEVPFKMTNADKAILLDKSDYRVFEPDRGFSNGRTSFYHKSISGYHAAKPKRIQDLYDYYILKNNYDILNMLNVKYIIKDDPDNPLGVTRNPNNFGNAWFVEDIVHVNNSEKELLSLGKIDLRNKAITQNISLKEKSFKKDSLNDIYLYSRNANKLIYKSNSVHNQFAVFSEAFYYRGWQAYIDNVAVDHYKVNYLLRGIEIPSGKHEIKFEFKPKVIQRGSIISVFAYLILILVFMKFIKEKFYV